MLFARLIRPFIRLWLHLTYRLSAHNLHAIPASGGALLVCNHPSFLDPVIIGAMSARPVRFVMHHRIHGTRGLRWFFRAMGTIPIAPKAEDAALRRQAFEEIGRALDDGELVCLFPEGRVTRDGSVGEFRPGVQRILAAHPVPVVPVALRGLWGSLFSWKHGAPMRTLPRRFRARVELIVGNTQPAAQLTASALRRLVVALRSADVCPMACATPR